MDSREVGVIVFAVAVVDIGVDGHIASTSIEATEKLQLATDVLVGTVTHRLVEAAVDNEALVVHRLQTNLIEWVGSIVEGVRIEGSRGGMVATIVSGNIEIGTEGKIGQ